MSSWLRHRPGGVGLRSECPGITGPWGRRRRGTRGPARSRERAWVGDAGVYTDWLKWPLGAALGHLCTLLRRELSRQLRRELRCELRRVARVTQPLERVGGAPSVATSSLVGKTGSARKRTLREWRRR